MLSGFELYRRWVPLMEKGVRPDPTRESEMEQPEDKPSKRRPCIDRR